MAIFIITFVGAVIVALLGLWSARIASAESKAKRHEAHVQVVEKRDNNTDDRNQGNPAAWDMAAGAKPRNEAPLTRAGR